MTTTVFSWILRREVRRGGEGGAGRQKAGVQVEDGSQKAMPRFHSDGNDGVSSAYYRIFMNGPKASSGSPTGLPASPDGFHSHATSGDRPDNATTVVGL